MFAAARRGQSPSLFDRLLRDGVHLFLWPDAVMHAKSAVIDGVWSTVGSFNLDQRSLLVRDVVLRGVELMLAKQVVGDFWDEVGFFGEDSEHITCL
jgi:phosphatidylserine/phosphatidylglycerophosphate/cardiolipin synthase-like enzyme